MTVIPSPVSSRAVPGAFGLEIGATAAIAAPAQLAAQVAAFIEDVARDTGFDLVSAAADDTKPVIVLDLVADLDAELPAPVGVSPGLAGAATDERYRLTVSDSVRIEAVDAAGVLLGLATLRQLIGAAEVSPSGSRTLAPLVIEDAPRFAWRSLKLDVARFWYPVDDITQVISQLARYKVAALVLHLVDNEGWRIDIEGFPEVSAASPQRYTQDDLRTMVAFAADRGITIIPELDLPGHCAALLDAHPEFGVRQHVEGHDIVYVDPSVPELWEFVRTAYRQLLEITGSSYLHIGADEAFRMPDELYGEFIHRACETVRDLGAEPIVYQEASRAGLTPGTLAQYWVDFAGPGGLIDDLEERANRGEELPFGMKPAAFSYYREGYHDQARADTQRLGVIASPTQHAYFDTPFAEASTDPAQEARRSQIGMPIYAPRPLDAFNDWDPSTAFGGIDPALVVGAEAALWSDAVTERSTMQLLLLPRLAGFAEHAWCVTPRPWSQFRSALAAQAPGWRSHGLEFFASSLVGWE